MDLDFEEFIEIPRIPSGTAKTARQALNIQKKAEEIGDLELAKQAALEAIINVDAGTEPSELKRLRLLYREVYTTEELKALVAQTFQILGVNQL